MMLAVIALVLAGGLLLFAFGNALGAKGRHQRAADLAASSAAQVMRDLYPRLFEPPFLSAGRAEPAPSGRGRVPRRRHRRRRQGRAAERGPRPGGGRELRRKRLRRDQGDRAGTRRGTRGARSPRPRRAGTARADPGSRPGDRRALPGGRWGVSRPGERRWVRRPARLPAGRADAAGRRARFRPHGGGRAR